MRQCASFPGRAKPAYSRVAQVRVPSTERWCPTLGRAPTSAREIRGRLGRDAAIRLQLASSVALRSDEPFDLLVAQRLVPRVDLGTE